MGVITIDYTAKGNSAPSQSGWNSFTIAYSTAHTFTLADFTTDTTPAYADPEGDPLAAIKITSLPDTGTLTLSNSNVNVNDTVTSQQLIDGDLVYTPITDLYGYLDSGMEFTVSDTGSNTFTSKPFQIVFQVEDDINEAPSIVGNGEADIQVGDTYVFTRASLTSQLNPPYEDPENNPAENLRVVSLPTFGELTLNSKPLIEGSIVPFTDIDSGLFVYQNDSLTQEGALEGFEFEISDTGSGEYRG